MAAAAATAHGRQHRQVECAAEMGLEHHLGLTCDPVGGLVRPCIERNAVAATRARSVALMALLSDGSHRIPFDEVVRVMKKPATTCPACTAKPHTAAWPRLTENARTNEEP